MTDDIQLREVIKPDLHIFFVQQLDPQATQMAAFPSRDWDAFTAHWARILDDESVTVRTILFAGQVAGHILSWEGFGKRELGYWLGSEFWGRGIATRALADFLDREKTRPLYAHVAQHNLASRRVLEKCGFAICATDQIMSEAGDEPVEEFILKLDPGAGDGKE